MDVLWEVLAAIEDDNPFGLVLKGGTAIAYHHAEGHRESEDLDFDVPAEHRARADDVIDFIESLLERLVNGSVIENYTVRKKGFSHRDRYHMNLVLTTYKDFRTKIDLDFVEIGTDLESRGELRFYTVEHMFVSKLRTFNSRLEFKDLYDISFLRSRVEPGLLDQETPFLIDRTVEVLDDEELILSYRKMLRDIDLRFGRLKDKDVDLFVKKIGRDLRVLGNILRK